MKKSLLIYLVLPLLCVSAGFLYFSWQAEGFFLNLGTELIGILVTVCYVEWILRRNEKSKWASTDQRIADRLRILLNATISGIRIGLGIEIEELGMGDTQDSIAIHKELVCAAEVKLVTVIPQRVRLLNQDGWKSLARQIAHTNKGIFTFLNFFQNRLSPEQIGHLLDLQEALSDAMTSYIVFPDIMGVAEDNLTKEKKSSHKALQMRGCKTASKELQRALSIVKTLSGTINS